MRRSETFNKRIVFYFIISNWLMSLRKHANQRGLPARPLNQTFGVKNRKQVVCQLVICSGLVSENSDLAVVSGGLFPKREEIKAKIDDDVEFNCPEEINVEWKFRNSNNTELKPLVSVFFTQLSCFNCRVVQNFSPRLNFYQCET